MSNTSSISNFYVDEDGREHPIHYKASDLVNHSAPDGYVWRRGNAKEAWMERMWQSHPSGFGWSLNQWPKEDHEYDYYYAAKKEEAP